MAPNFIPTLTDNMTRIHRSRLWACTCILQLLSTIILFHYYFPGFSTIRTHFGKDQLLITQALVLGLLLLDILLRVYLIGSDFLKDCFNKLDVLMLLSFTACFVYMCLRKFTYYGETLDIIVISIRCVLIVLRSVHVIKATWENVKNQKQGDELEIALDCVNFNQNARQQAASKKIEGLDFENRLKNASGDNQTGAGKIGSNVRLVQVNRNPKCLVVKIEGKYYINYTSKPNTNSDDAYYCGSPNTTSNGAVGDTRWVNQTSDALPTMGRLEVSLIVDDIVY